MYENKFGETLHIFQVNVKIYITKIRKIEKSCVKQIRYTKPEH